MMKIFEMYKNLYLNNLWRKTYLVNRKKLYEKIFNIVKELNVTNVLGIGCSFGLLVDLLNSSGITAYGLNFPIKELIDFHKKFKM